MKKLWLLLFFTISIGVVCANPLMPILVSRVWFGDNDSLYVQIGDEIGGLYPLTSYRIFTDMGEYHLPPTFVEPTAYPAIINLSQEIPSMIVNRQSDNLTFMDSSAEWLVESLAWGSEDVYPYVNIHPLTEGQCAVQFRIPIYDGTIYTWAKEYNSSYYPPSVPQSMCDLNIQVRDQNNDPLPYYRIYVCYSNGIPPYSNNVYPTSPNGTVTAIAYPAHVWVFIKDPVANEVVWSGNTCLEPNFPNYLNATITVVSNEDETETPQPGVFSVYPTVLRGDQTQIRISYDKPADLPKSTSLALYDLRGRLVTSFDADLSSEYSAELPKLDSGIYFLRLYAGEREFGNRKLTVIK